MSTAAADGVEDVESFRRRARAWIADNLAPLVDTVFGPSAAPTGADVLVAAWAFAFWMSER